MTRSCAMRENSGLPSKTKSLWQPCPQWKNLNGVLSYRQSPGRVRLALGTINISSLSSMIAFVFCTDWQYRSKALNRSRKDFAEFVVVMFPSLSLLRRGITAMAFVAALRNEGLPGTCEKAAISFSRWLLLSAAILSN